MNIGKNILELRKQKSITQEELAAELGVTAAAVSKWENGYTLPDILMLCALADFFEVTTDELLGRNSHFRYAVIATTSSEKAQKIAELARRYGFIAKHFCESYAEALEVSKADPDITHLFVSFDNPMEEAERGEVENLFCVESHAGSMQHVLDGFELYFKNMSTYDAIAKHNKSKN